MIRQEIKRGQKKFKRTDLTVDDKRCTNRLDKRIKTGDQVQITVDGQTVKANKGETIATALMRAGYFTSRTIDSKPRGVYCNIGLCYSCVMTVNGIQSVRICNTPVSEGCRIETQHFRTGLGNESQI